MTKVKVCDAIMGTGKSSAAINYMNEHPTQKFIYITPYNDEAMRIRACCPKAVFYNPQKMSKHYGSKVLHTMDLVKRGESVATTHEAFRRYPPELLDYIKKGGYTLFIDENINVLDTMDEDPYDVQMFIDAGYIREGENNTFQLVNDVYKGCTHRDFFRMMRTREVIRISSDELSHDCFYYWQLPASLITSFKEVYILTYRFKGQSLFHFLEMNGIPFEYIGVKMVNGEFQFSESGDGYVPDYVKSLASKIHIVEDDKLNAIGEDKFALSMSWFNKQDSDVDQLRKHVSNFFKHRCPGVGAGQRLWSTYSESYDHLKDRGYKDNHVSFNIRATNDFKNAVALAYCVNLFMNVGQVLFYKSNGIEVDQDEYALSTMVQWIWRSAIRDGHEITIYIPSKRMRTLLKSWIEEVSQL